MALSFSCSSLDSEILAWSIHFPITCIQIYNSVGKKKNKKKTISEHLPKRSPAPVITHRTVMLYPGNATKCTCVRFSWVLISSSQRGSDAAARQQRASRDRPNRTDMMRSTSRNAQGERMGPVFPQSCCEAGGADINMGDGESLEGSWQVGGLSYLCVIV